MNKENHIKTFLYGIEIQQDDKKYIIDIPDFIPDGATIFIMGLKQYELMHDFGDSICYRKLNDEEMGNEIME